MQKGSVFSQLLLIFSSSLHFYDSLWFSFSGYSQRICFHRDSHIPTAEGPSMGCAALSCPLPPSQASHVGSCCCAGRVPVPGPSLQCSAMQGTRQQLVLQSPTRGVFAAQQSPATPLRLQGRVLGFSFQLQALSSPHCARQKQSEQRELSGVLVMIPSAPFMIS